MAANGCLRSRDFSRVKSLFFPPSVAFPFRGVTLDTGVESSTSGSLSRSRYLEKLSQILRVSSGEVRCARTSSRKNFYRMRESYGEPPTIIEKKEEEGRDTPLMPDKYKNANGANGKEAETVRRCVEGEIPRS